MSDHKIAVYLTSLDWRAVLKCMDVQLSVSTSNPDVQTVISIGKDRLRYIKNRIEERIASPTPEKQP